MAQGRQTSLAQHQQRQQRDNDRRGEANNEKNALLAPTQDDFAPARVLGGVSLRLGAFLSNHRAMNGRAQPLFQLDEEVVMAKKPADARRKLVEFDAETWQALDLLARESMKTVQELADEAFRDLLHKYGRPTDLKAALRQSARSSAPRASSHARRGQRG